MKRTIGIRHRVKRLADGEASPTQVAILEGGEMRTFDLPTETDELDFLQGQFPVERRKPKDDEDLAAFKVHHIGWRKLRKDEDAETIPANLLRHEGKETLVAKDVPAAYDGLQSGDTVAMLLGGSGDNFAFALSKRAGKLSAKAPTEVLRIPPFRFKEWRATDDKSGDAELLANLAGEFATALFYETDTRDRALILVRECYRALIEAMKARIGCEQRLHQRVIGSIFCNEEGEYPEGEIEKVFDEHKANDKIW